MIRRILFFCFIMVPVLIIIVPLQWVLLWLNFPYWNALPRFFHRVACVFLGMRVHLIGKPVDDRPALLVSNHVSWTDILAIGSVANLTFVAKRDVGQWPVVGFMASLQRTLYVDYTRRRDTQRTYQEMASRLASNSAVLLFAEGHRDLGDHVQPFRSALVGAAQAAMTEGGAENVAIQPVTIAYTHLQGLPVGRTERSLISGITSKTFKEVVWDLLTSGVKEVSVAFGEPQPLSEEADRKAVTKVAENEVRRTLVALNRGRPLPVPLEGTAQPAPTMQN